MRPFAKHDHNTLRRGILVLGLIAGLASSASAQLITDGNLLWQNGATNTVAAQFGTGAPTGTFLTACNATYGEIGRAHV